MMEAEEHVYEVFEIGSEVLVGGDIPAIISALEIRSAEHLLTYQVTWWDERNRKSEWVLPQEVKAATKTGTRSLRFVDAA